MGCIRQTVALCTFQTDGKPSFRIISLVIHQSAYKSFCFYTGQQRKFAYAEKAIGVTQFFAVKKKLGLSGIGVFQPDTPPTTLQVALRFQQCRAPWFPASDDSGTACCSWPGRVCANTSGATR